MSGPSVDADRILADIEAIAGFSETPPLVGYSRPTFSEAWAQARAYVIAEAEAAGGETRTDGAGNLHIRSRQVGWERKVWLSGSHIDSVPSGGKYDGVMGVVIPLEILRVAPELPLELVVFAEEEGTTFGLGMLGSRGWSGEISGETLARLRNRHGESYIEAGRAYGVDPEQLGTLDGNAYFGLVEVHAEQGISLWNEGRPLALVDRINGRRQIEARLLGEANHAGSTGMLERKDALACAAEVIVESEQLGRRYDRELAKTVVTVGVVEAEPNAANVIAGQVRLTVDFRAQEEEMLSRGEAEIRRRIEEIAAHRGIGAEVLLTERIEPSPLSEALCNALATASQQIGYPAPLVPSGALHDAAVLAPHLPTAMVFVASKDGISHNPGEFSRIEDIAGAAQLLAQLFWSRPEGLTDG